MAQAKMLGILPEFYTLRHFVVMKKPFDKTLSSIAEIDEAIGLLKSEMIISDPRKKEDLQKIVYLLDSAAKLLVESITVFAKYEDHL